jgi:alkylation response protein AidB-like acyl-CoA dehydrogenase
MRWQQKRRDATKDVTSLSDANRVRPSAKELIARAEALIPLVSERAAATEANGRIDADLARRLIDAGFYHIVMPERAGGYGMRHTVLWEVTRHIGRGCASTGWILGLIGISPWIVGFFPERAQDEVFTSGNPIVPVMTGGVGRELSVTSNSSGYEINGTWSYGSGIDLCTWAIVMAPLPPSASTNTSETGLFLVPAEAFSIDNASWNVLGMRGTGSKTVRLSRTRVPAHRAISWSAAQRGEFPGKAVNDDPMFKMPVNALFAMSVVAPIVAAAFGALDQTLTTLRSRFRVGTAQEQKGEAFTQIEVGRSAAQLDMAYSTLISDSNEMYEIVASGRSFSLDERAKYRAHCSSIARTVLHASDRLFALTGGGLIKTGSALERYFRDLHSMTTHFLMQPDVTNETYGRVLLGLAPRDGARI